MYDEAAAAALKRKIHPMNALFLCVSIITSTSIHFIGLLCWAQAAAGRILAAARQQEHKQRSFNLIQIYTISHMISLYIWYKKICMISRMISYKKKIASFKQPTGREQTRHVRRGKDRVQTQDLGHWSRACYQLRYRPCIWYHTCYHTCYCIWYHTNLKYYNIICDIIGCPFLAPYDVFTISCYHVWW